MSGVGKYPFMGPNTTALCHSWYTSDAWLGKIVSGGRIWNDASYAWLWNCASDAWFQNIASDACQTPARYNVAKSGVRCSFLWPTSSQHRNVASDAWFWNIASDSRQPDVSFWIQASDIIFCYHASDVQYESGFVDTLSYVATQYSKKATPYTITLSTRHRGRKKQQQKRLSKWDIIHFIPCEHGKMELWLRNSEHIARNSKSENYSSEFEVWNSKFENHSSKFKTWMRSSDFEIKILEFIRSSKFKKLDLIFENKDIIFRRPKMRKSRNMEQFKYGTI